jgi:hypothetical protein
MVHLCLETFRLVVSLCLCILFLSIRNNVEKIKINKRKIEKN